MPSENKNKIWLTFNHNLFRPLRPNGRHGEYPQDVVVIASAQSSAALSYALDGTIAQISNAGRENVDGFELHIGSVGGLE